MVRLAHSWLCVILAIVSPTQGLAQAPAPASPQTREESLKLAREEKQKSLAPPTPNALEKGMRLAEEHLAPLLTARDGIHLKLGSLATGSGFAYGAGYRHRRLFDREAALTAWAAGSLKRYWAVEGRFDLPDLADGRLEIGTVRSAGRTILRKRTSGWAPQHVEATPPNFQLKNTRVGGRVGIKPSPVVAFGGGVEYSRPVLGPGRNSRIPSIEALFDETSAPGLFGAENFLRTSAFLHVDYRQPRNARRGGWYRIDASHVADASDAHTFNRVDVDLRQYASILAERRVFAVRLFVSTSDPASGARVPFYLMPHSGRA